MKFFTFLMCPLLVLFLYSLFYIWSVCCPQALTDRHETWFEGTLYEVEDFIVASQLCIKGFLGSNTGGRSGLSDHYSINKAFSKCHLKDWSYAFKCHGVWREWNKRRPNNQIKIVVGEFYFISISKLRSFISRR